MRRRSGKSLIAFQGERGAFSEEAARKLLGADNRSCHVPASKMSFAVCGRRGGGCGDPHRKHTGRFRTRKLRSPAALRIPHRRRNQRAHRSQFDGAARRAIPKKRRVYSHPVALNQCLDFFAHTRKSNASPITIQPAASKWSWRRGSRCRSNRIRGGRGNLWRTNLAPIHKATGRISPAFFLRTPEYTRQHPVTPPKAQWKTSLVFSTRNIPGALSEV